MRLVIGGCGIGLPATLRLSAALRAFQHDHGSFDLVFDLEAAPRTLIGQPLFIADRVWELWGAGTERQIVMRAPHDSVPFATVSWQQTWPRRCVVHHDPTYDPAGLLFEYPIVQLQLMEYLADHGGALLHACGVLHNGYALALVGAPGVGKSTSARLWQAAGATILSDDRLVIRAHDDQLWLHGTPWHSSTAAVSPLAAPLQQVLLLRHGASNTITQLATSAAIHRLLPEVYLPLWRASAVEQVLGLVDQLAGSVPIAEFAFVPDQTAVAVLQSAKASNQ